MLIWFHIVSIKGTIIWSAFRLDHILRVLFGVVRPSKDFLVVTRCKESLYSMLWPTCISNSRVERRIVQLLYILNLVA